MRDDSALLVSVKPPYAELILSGVKTVELRRVRPNVAAGGLVLIYASSPTMQMVGTATVEAVSTGSLDAIWQQAGHATGLDRATFDEYFSGRDTAVAINLTDVKRLRRVIPLAELRRRINGFRPPQSFRYIPHSQVPSVT
jgi:predicted transcriptional regulator